MTDEGKTASAAEKRVVDWEAVERDYRAGVKPLKAIGREFGVSDAGIIKRAKRDGWERDLAAKIAARAEAKVSKAAVSAEVSAQRKVSEQTIVEANAQVQADAILSQRRDIKRARSIVQRLFVTLEAKLDAPGDLAKLGELMFNPDKSGRDKLNEVYYKVIDFPSQVDSAKKLMEAERIGVEVERKVLRIKDDDSAEEMGKKIGAGLVMGSNEAYYRLLNGGDS